MEFFGHAESWVLVSFILFLALLVYLKVPAMLGKMLDGRADKIAQELNNARKLREEAEAFVHVVKLDLAGGHRSHVSFVVAVVVVACGPTHHRGTRTRLAVAAASPNLVGVAAQRQPCVACHAASNAASRAAVSPGPGSVGGWRCRCCIE